jgi:hypothetical protein
MFNAKGIDVVYLHASDNVCVAARDLAAGARLSAGGRDVQLAGPVKLGHKIALQPIAAGKPVVKYGQTIGFATEAIAPGAWIHTHNLTAGQFARDYAAATEIPPDPPPGPTERDSNSASPCPLRRCRTGARAHCFEEGPSGEPLFWLRN